MTIRETLRAAQLQLKQAGVPDPAVDAGWMLAHVMGVKRLEVLARGDQPLDPRDEEAFERLLQRRLQREPLQYIIGETVFMGHRILCRPPVLIPRSDTEVLAEQALQLLKPGQRALDLCCGSGAIAVSLKLGCPDASVYASDLSGDALALTMDNAALHGVRLRVEQGDLLAPFAGVVFDLICCNPPYIPTAHLAHLQAEVGFEPVLALDGGEDGMDLYRRIIAQAPACLCPGGWLLLEAGDAQARPIADLLQVEFDHIRVYDDLNGLPRLVAARRKGTHALAD